MSMFEVITQPLLLAIALVVLVYVCTRFASIAWHKSKREYELDKRQEEEHLNGDTQG